MESNILFKQKQTRILLMLKDTSQNWYISNLAKTSGTTYVHTCNFIAKCEAHGITSSERHGKLKLIKLTDRGAKIADMIAAISSMVNSASEQQKQ
ncbi:MAG: hypothetical protein ACREBH_02970 [Candidatus Micrarchaeaceae archaeon]